jgi:NAD(P)H-flavin reductase
MDAARWARRLGSETTIQFRRGRAELRARLEEIEHAEEEGIRFEFLAAPVRLIGDEGGQVREMESIRMQLGEPDESGRPSPVPLPGSEYRIAVDTVVMAIGQRPNPTVQRATPQLITTRGKITIDEGGHTSMPGVFAGGDVVRGGSTVILAMRDGRAAAEAIDRALAVEREISATTRRQDRPTSARNRVLERRWLAPEIAWIEVEAPEISGHWNPGQFVIVRPTATSERIPLTIVGGSTERGTIHLVVQAVGKTSRQTASLCTGDHLADLLGPLGRPATIENVGSVLCVGGGVGSAELLPVTRALRQVGNHVTVLCGARSAAYIILDQELRSVADEVCWATDDGSGGFPGTVIDLMRAWRIEQAEPPAVVHITGPIPMMRAAAAMTREWNVPTFASLNPIMVDGTGMCGGCRVTVGGVVCFACMDGPEFDAHRVDFDELARRTGAYREQERLVLERAG